MYELLKFSCYLNITADSLSDNDKPACLRTDGALKEVVVNTSRPLSEVHPVRTMGAERASNTARLNLNIWTPSFKDKIPQT